MSNLRMWTLVGLVAVACLPAYGCGSECASGTVDDDGQCVVDEAGCAEGARLENGACVLDKSGCGPNTMLDGNVCVPIPELCRKGTTFDQGDHSCTPNAEVLCGEHTEVGSDGACVPADGACADTTLLEEGQCIVGAPACGDGTELDATTGKCVLFESGCGSGLAYDAASSTCVPTDEICEPGTKFDADSGLCLNASCNSGDALVDGRCVSPAEDLARQPDQTEAENNDPSLGGAAQVLTLGPADSAATTFVGAIGEPTDLDGDGVVDQDRDVYEFDAAAGEWFDIKVLSTGLPAPAFVVEGPDGFERSSPIGRDRDATRSMVAPVEGAYTITVAPSLVLAGGEDFDAVGGADRTYVGSVRVISTPAGADVDMSGGSARISGDYRDLSDNLFNLTGLQAKDLVRISGTKDTADVDGLVHQLDAAGLPTVTETLGAHTALDLDGAGMTPRLLVDWSAMSGPDTTFELSANVVGGQTTVTMPADVTETLVASAEADDYIVATQTNQADASLEVTVIDPLGSEAASSAVESGGELRMIAQEAGDYIVNFKNASGSSVDADLKAVAVPLPTLGPLAGSPSGGSTDTYDHRATLPDGATIKHKIIVAEAGTIHFGVTPTGTGDPDVTLYDSSMTEIGSWAAYGGESFSVDLSAGTYFLEVEAYSEIAGYSVNARFVLPPPYASSPGLAIPDDTPAGVTDTLTVAGSGCAAIGALSVKVDITHGWIGDLTVELTSPSGTTVVLHDQSGGSSSDINGWYPDDLQPASAGGLSVLAGEPLDGDWQLKVADNAAVIDGTLNGWGLRPTCP